MKNNQKYEEDVLHWISNLSDKQFADFFYKATLKRNTADSGKGHFVLADAWKLPEEPWLVDFIALPSAHEISHESMICQSGECNSCGSKLRSWAKKAICPVCGKEINCT
jgi:hypothetical protein